jgi:hypothetical protein
MLINAFYDQFSFKFMSLLVHNQLKRESFLFLILKNILKFQSENIILLNKMHE